MKGRIKRSNPNEVKAYVPRIGFIKTGLKDANGYPKSVDYFLATGNYKGFFEKAYGKVSTIQIIFFSDDIAFSCSEEYSLIDHMGSLFGKGDGEAFYIWNGDEYQELSIKDYPNLMESAAKRANSKKGWEVVLTLRFIIPKISNVIGHWEYKTKAEASSIPQIRETFDTVLQSRGSVTGMVFDLNVSFAKSFKPGVGTRYPVVSLVPNNSDENLELVKKSLVNLSNEQKKLN